jgi:hypothetical protein
MSRIGAPAERFLDLVGVSFGLRPILDAAHSSAREGSGASSVGMRRRRRTEAGLAFLVRTQPCHRAWLDWQRRPPGDAPSTFPRLGVVGNPREPSAQLDSSRQLSFLSEDSANCGGIGFGDNEHPDSMLARITVGKRRVCPSICWIGNTAPLAAPVEPVKDIIGYSGGGSSVKDCRFAVFIRRVRSPWSWVWTANVIRLGSHRDVAVVILVREADAVAGLHIALTVGNPIKDETFGRGAQSICLILTDGSRGEWEPPLLHQRWQTALLLEAALLRVLP